MASTDFSASATPAAFKGGLHSFTNRITFTPVAADTPVLATIAVGSGSPTPVTVEFEVQFLKLGMAA